jgi:hypothetical protein
MTVLACGVVLQVHLLANVEGRNDDSWKDARQIGRMVKTTLFIP